MPAAGKLGNSDSTYMPHKREVFKIENEREDQCCSQGQKKERMLDDESSPCPCSKGEH